MGGWIGNGGSGGGGGGSFVGDDGGAAGPTPRERSGPQTHDSIGTSLTVVCGRSWPILPISWHRYAHEPAFSVVRCTSISCTPSLSKSAHSTRTDVGAGLVESRYAWSITKEGVELNIPFSNCLCTVGCAPSPTVIKSSSTDPVEAPLHRVRSLMSVSVVMFARVRAAARPVPTNTSTTLSPFETASTEPTFALDIAAAPVVPPTKSVTMFSYETPGRGFATIGDPSDRSMIMA